MDAKDHLGCNWSKWELSIPFQVLVVMKYAGAFDFNFGLLDGTADYNELYRTMRDMLYVNARFTS